MDGELGVSYSVLVVPEDPTHNGDILEPLIVRMLAQCGKPNARVLVLTNPKVQGYEHARQKLPEILERYRHFDLILFLVDADGKDKAAVFEALESKAASNGLPLFCAAAEQEVEVWLLAGHAEKLEIPWGEVRRDISVKENVFEPFLSKYGDRRRYGGGRDLLMREAVEKYDQILQRCPELQRLQGRITQLLRLTSPESLL
jgi:hypothetical protein